jgi:hypothetical protein
MAKFRINERAKNRASLGTHNNPRTDLYPFLVALYHNII